ncbi:MAG: TlpA family protein disulfide reductase [Akkermansiaceae bacterium]|nr:TlpA family protein disulfide reductase [Akkermansiaceae bacterium]
MSGLMLAIQLFTSPAFSAEAGPHKLTDWKLGSSLFGDKVSKSSLKGQVVLLEYWGVNCPPCIASLPHLAKLDKSLRDKGLRIVGAESQNSSKEQIKPIIEKAKVEYSIVGYTSGPIAVNGIPHAFLFDRKGDLIFDGSPFDGELEKLIKKSLREKTESAAPVVASGPLIPTRTWTNAEGREIRAAVKSVDETKVAFLMTNGKLVSYPLEKLSEESRELILEAAKPQQETAIDEDA